MKSGLRRMFRNKTQGPPVSLAPYGHGRGLTFNLGVGTQARESQTRTYASSGTVYSIVSLLASSAARPSWHLYRKQPLDGRRRYSHNDQGSDQRTEVVRHAALSLWNAPNDFHTGFEFREGANQHLELTGETFWVLSRNGTSFPTSMWYVHPSRMEPVTDPNDFMIGWIYTGYNGEQVPLRLDEVICEKLPDPNDPFRGLGPVQAIMPNIQQQRYATEYQRNMFLNGAEPSGVIEVPTQLSEPEFDELIDRWRESHQGVARAGRVGVLERGAKFVERATTNRDLEYAELRQTNREEMREAWRIHAHMLGIVDDVNRANAETAEESFGRWSVIPRLDRRRDTLNCKLLPMFGAEDVEFDYEDPLPGNRADDNAELTAKASAAQALVDAGYDPEMVLEVVGLPAMDFVGQPKSLSGPEPAEPLPTLAAPDTDHLAALLRRYPMNRIGAGR